MSMLKDRKFSFTSQAFTEDAFAVIDFTGEEGLSQCYEFQINLVSEQADIDLDPLIHKPACFTIHTEDGDQVYHGVVIYADQLHQSGRYTYYHVVLAPRLYGLHLTRHNQVFLNQTIPEIIGELLKDTGLTALDFEMRLRGDGTSTYQPWELFCQIRETHFHFFSYWTERAGLYYFFEQGRDREKVIITDTKLSHVQNQGRSTLEYSPPSGLLAPPDKEAVHYFSCRRHIQPRKVMVRDYDYCRPSDDLAGEAEVCPDGWGQVYIYGDHMKFNTAGGGSRLAQLRAEEIICRKQIFTGRSNAPNLKPGFTFELEGHFRRDFNQKYLTTRISHQGSQAGFLNAEVRQGLGHGEEESFYQNEFKAIPAEVQFRPERQTSQPKIWGTFNAVIDASGSGKYAEIDEHGRYKVILPFDLSGRQGLKASAWLRMAQPFTGDGHGMHFPLHKGVEVLLSFISGDPNRPVIIGSVPNEQNRSVVNAHNATMSGIQSAGGNMIHMEDQDGEQRIVMRSGGPRNSVFKMGHGSPLAETLLGSDFLTSFATLGNVEICNGIKNAIFFAKSCTTTGMKACAPVFQAVTTAANAVPGIVMASAKPKTKIGKLGVGLAGKLTIPIVELLTKLIDFNVKKILLKKSKSVYKNDLKAFKDVLEIIGGRLSFSVIHQDGLTSVNQAGDYALPITKGMLLHEGRGSQVFFAKEQQRFIAGDGIRISSDISSDEKGITLDTKNGVTRINAQKIELISPMPSGLRPFKPRTKKGIELGVHDGQKIEIYTKTGDIDIGNKETSGNINIGNKEANSEIDISNKKKITIEAGDSLEIKVGQAEIIMKKDGQVTITGKLKIEGDVTMAKACEVEGTLTAKHGVLVHESAHFTCRITGNNIDTGE